MEGFSAMLSYVLAVYITLLLAFSYIRFFTKDCTDSYRSNTELNTVLLLLLSPFLVPIVIVISTSFSILFATSYLMAKLLRSMDNVS